MAVCIPTCQLASGLIAEGMNWWQAVLTVLLGNLIVLAPMTLNARAGTAYGIPFPVLPRSSFGVFGANIQALMRAVVACGWFGIQNFQPPPYTGPSLGEVLQLRREFVNPALFHYYREPLMVVAGRGQYLFDEKGRRYLDGFGGIVTVSVGHCHPHVVAAANRQNETLQHTTTIYLHPNIARYAGALASRMPGNLKVCYFVNSGSEANDLALLMARACTGNFDMIALRNGYHGGSQSTMALTSHHTWKFNTPHSFGVHHAVAPDLYRRRWTSEDSGPRYAEEIQNLIQFATPGRGAGFIAESIQGVGGSVVFPDGYLKDAPTVTSGRRAGFASPMKCRPDPEGPVPISGDSKPRTLFPTSSPWPRGSATAVRWARWSRRRRSRPASPSGFISIPSAAIP